MANNRIYIVTGGHTDSSGNLYNENPIVNFSVSFSWSEEDMAMYKKKLVLLTIITIILILKLLRHLAQ